MLKNGINILKEHVLIDGSDFMTNDNIQEQPENEDTLSASKNEDKYYVNIENVTQQEEIGNLVKVDDEKPLQSQPKEPENNIVKEIEVTEKEQVIFKAFFCINLRYLNRSMIILMKKLLSICFSASLDRFIL